MRATSRLTGVAKKTVERLLVSAGTACADYMDEHMRNLNCKVLQVDEIWSFTGAKEANVPVEMKGKGRGDTWTWVCIDADTKLIPSWFVGRRTLEDATEFIADIKSRLAGRVQLTSDGYAAYIRTVADVFGPDDIDYAILHKLYGRPIGGEIRYSPPVCTGASRKRIFGNPDRNLISTSYIERSNLTFRMSNRRFTRLTNGYSKKIENHVHMMAISMMYYNYCRIHHTLRMTPAMAAGISDHVWSLEEVVNLIK
jgi:IS1 family transposase